jgi:hypothetical protein
MKRYVTAILICISLHGFTQNNYIKTNSMGQPYDIISTTDGGAMVTGNGNSTGTAFLLKVDANGDQQWAKSYTPNDASFFGNSVVQTSDGGYAMLGHHLTSPNYEMILIRTDNVGDTLWTKRYPSSSFSDSQPNSKQIITTSDNGFLISGTTNLVGSGGDDMMAIKLNSNGLIQWQKTYGDGGDEEGHSVVELPNGYALGGRHLIRIDDNGDTLWTRSYGPWIRGISYTSDGYILTSVQRNMGLEVTKWDTNGNVIWKKALLVDNNSMHGKSIWEAQDGQYFVSGTYYEWTTGAGSFLYRMDTSGNQIFQEYYPNMAGGMAFDDGYSTQLSNGSYLISGSYVADASLVSVNAVIPSCSTVPQNMTSYYITTPHVSAHLSAVTTGNISLNPNPGLFYSVAAGTTTTHCEVIGVEEFTEEQVLEVYPNPAQDFIRFNAVKQIENIRVFDGTGRLIMQKGRLISNQLNIEQLSVGIYHVEVQFKKGIQAVSFVKVR